jgi:hypothetical protein
LGYAFQKERIIFETLLKHLQKIGNVRVSRVVTHLAEHDIDLFIRALAFVRSARFERKRHGFFVRLQKNKSFIKKKYFKNGQYVFPFQHVVITLTKT